MFICLLLFVSIVFGFDLFVDPTNGVDRVPCGLSQDTACETIVAAYDYNIKDPLGMAKMSTHEEITIKIADGRITSSFPWSIFYSRFDFMESVPKTVRFIANNSRKVLIDQRVTLRGDIEHTGLVFEHDIFIDVTSEGYKLLFVDCWFHDQKNVAQLFAAITSEARSSLEIAKSQFDSRGVHMKRGSLLSIKDSTFSGVFDDDLSMTTTFFAKTLPPNVTDPTNPPKTPETMAKIGAFVLSAAASNLIDNCHFNNIQTHGDVAMISWDGQLSKVDGADEPVAPKFTIQSTHFENVDIHYMDNMNGNTLPGIGGAVFVYDCSQSDVKNQEKCVKETNVVVKNCALNDIQTGHSLFLISGTMIDMDNITISDCQTISNQHAGAAIVLDNTKGKIQNSKLTNVGPNMNPLAHPNTWQLAGGFILKNATLQITKTTLEQLRGWQSGVLWCEKAQISIDSQSVDLLKDNSGTEVPYGPSKGRATSNVFMNATENTDKNWSCGIECTVKQDGVSHLCPREYQVPLPPTVMPTSSSTLSKKHFLFIALLANACFMK